MIIRTKHYTGIAAAAIVGAALFRAPLVLAHAFPEAVQPGVGAVLHDAPKLVRIRYDSGLEEEFSEIVVKDSNGNRVSGRTKLDPASRKTLEAGLKDLEPGDYHVYWTVVSWDGHRTKGDYVFHFNP